MKLNASALTRNLAFIAGAALLALVVATPSGAGLGQWNSLRFSGPVALPNAILPTGAYVFEVANPGSSHPVVRVTNRDTRRVYFAGFTEIVPRPANLPGDQVVTFGEAPAGMPVPIATWYPTGRSEGHRFIYR
jgi:hypothetical protein